MKKVTILSVVLLIAMLLSACSGISQDDYDKAIADYEAAQKMIETLTEQLEDANSSYSRLQADKDILQAKYDAATATPEPVSREDNSPWNTPLSEGLTAEIQRFDDGCTMFIHYKNNTGEDISLTTYYIFGDDMGNAFMQGAASTMFIADGAEFIEVIEAWDEIAMFGLDYDITSPYKKIREANEALSVDHWKNANGSVSATFSAPGGASVSGNLFFLDESGEVLGYQSFGIGFSESMDYEFDIPDFEYSDYLLCYEALA